MSTYWSMVTPTTEQWKALPHPFVGLEVVLVVAGSSEYSACMAGGRTGEDFSDACSTNLHTVS